MNNKKLGTEFEEEVVMLLSQKGYWSHFITPKRDGSQPFDVIASKDNKPLVGDCKTSVKKWFNISRLEDNQITALDLWLRTGNSSAFIFIKYNEKIYQIPYRMLKGLQRINLEECENFVIW